MGDENPFSEPDDTDKTVIRPNPGGRRPSIAPQPAAPHAPGPAQDLEPGAATAPPGGTAGTAAPYGVPGAQPAQDVAGDRAAEAALGAGMTGTNPLNACAATLFSLVSRIRNRAQHAEPAALREAVVAEIRAFEARALKAGIDPQKVKIARYAICATLDDVVLNTPWGGESIWAQKSLVGTFHRETVGGDRFYDLLSRLEQDPGRNIELLEFLFMCLSLGFEGRLRVDPSGRARHAEVREGLAGIIRNQRGAAETALSPHWQGLDRPHRAVAAWKPVWIAVGAVAALLGSGFLGLSYALSGGTERVAGRLAALDPPGPAVLERRAPPVIPPEPDTTQIEKVSGFLTEEIDEGIVEVFQDATTVTVRLTGTEMFAPASDRLQDRFLGPLEHVGAALVDTEGPVIVVGHSDSTPIRSARFASNMELSLARAESVREMLAERIERPDRLRAEGRSDKEPVAGNDTAEGRAANRRIEIVLIRQETDQ
ncbi:type IVB secretion system protein IcmH/DotU [Rhodosalinus sp.]|uniref:type IVB secretion system protein IcmH/DotU n=1 Tax=Rhodosalinus sp. TaxID=2047741 RepID=UPI0035638290